MIPGLLEAGTALIGVLAPAAVDIFKTKVLGMEPQGAKDVLGSLAKSNPDKMADFVKAQADLMDAETRTFNRDVIGIPSGWVVDIRAAIRPVVTVASIIMLAAEMLPFGFVLDPGTRATLCLIVSYWFGSRVATKD
jgi:hypothetical protein